MEKSLKDLQDTVNGLKTTCDNQQKEMEDIKHHMEV